MAHTPGPWHSPRGSVGVFTDNNERIADCATLLSYGSPRSAEIGANADLIAAAPDLLAALQAMCDFAAYMVEMDEKNCEHMTDTDHQRWKENAHRARAVIAKAEGRE